MLRISRRILTAGLGAALLPLGARADDFPMHPLTLVVPFVAGGAIDVLARLVADRAGRTLGQNIVIDNRSGAAGLIGAAAVARGGARRLHAADGLGGAGHHPAVDQPVAQLPSAARSRAGCASGRHADGADRGSQVADQDGQ